MRIVVLAVLLLGCDRLACVAPDTCASVCTRVASGSSSWLDDPCQCVVSCDLGVCNGVPICRP